MCKGEYADHSGGLTILSESELREVSKSLSTLLPGPNTPVYQPQFEDGSIHSLQKLLERLFFTADSTTLTISHGAAALGALSGFLDRCSIASNYIVKAIVLNEETLRQILSIYLFRAENHKPKPLRRLLITCGLLINRLSNEDHRSRVVEEALKSCVQAICEPELVVAIKSAIQLLEHLLSKQIIDAAPILDKASPLLTESVRELPEVEDGDSVQPFVGKVLEWVQYPDCAPAISHFLPLFFDSVRALRKAITADQTVPEIQGPSLWIESVRHFMRIHPESFSVLEEHILPALLAHHKEGIGDFIHSLSPFSKNHLLRESDEMDDVLLCLLACRTASRMGSTQVHTLGLSQAGSSLYSIDPTSLSLSFLDHASPSVRLNALTTLVSLVKPAEAFESRIVVRLKECIPYFLLETSSKPRNEFIAAMKKFSNNIRMAAPALTGKATEYERSNAAEFLLWYIRFLVQELRPTAPYQTHITALNLILGFLQSFSRDLCVNHTLHLITPNPEQQEMLFKQLARVLLDLLFNAFDDVRQCSAEILELFVESEFHTRSNTLLHGSQTNSGSKMTMTIINQILDCVPRAEDLFRQSARADYADGLGRLLSLASYSRQCSSNFYDQEAMYYDLVYELQSDIDEAVKDLDHAVRTAPLHGHLIALRYIIGRPQTSSPRASPAYLSTFAFARNLLPLWNDIWNIVRPILCVDAPEGQVFPVSSSGDVAYGDQAKLSSCWRALKESSLLMSAAISRIQSNACDLGEANSIRDDYQSIGELVFEQLAELRHRGAFSTVSQTFAAWCIACRRLPGFECLLFPFYQKILACIHQKADAFTRRSAGLPAMVTGLLAAFPSGPFFDDVLLDLQAIADAPFEDTKFDDLLQLPQVHALNCLKDVFTDARFAFSSEPHISDCLHLAAQCLDSLVWAIRNCGLMLLKALLNRINGGTDTSSTRVSSSHRRFSKLIYEKYPHLPQLTLSLLSPISSHGTGRGGAGGSLHAQKIFPGLEIVERFGLPLPLREPIEGAVRRHLEGPVWPLREKAARALSAGSASIDIVTEVKNLLSSPWKSQNALHGGLLYLRSLLLQKKGVLQAQSTTDALCILFDQHLERYVLEHECPITAASFLDMVADVFEGVQQRVNEAPKQKEDSKPKSVIDESGESFIRRCAPLIDKVVEASNVTSGSADQALLVKSSNRLRDLLKHTKHDTIETDPAGPLKLLLPTFPNSPQAQEVDLCQQGEVLGVQFAQRPDNLPVLVTMTMWTRSLVLASTDSPCGLEGRPFWNPARLQKAPQDPETRLSTVSSIQNFVHGFSAASGRSQETPEFLYIWLLLCDLLVDDDEDVRTQTAELICEMLHKSAQQTGSVKQPWMISPPATKGRLLDYLVHSYCRSDRFWAETIVRMTGQLARVGLRSRVAAPGGWERHDFDLYQSAIESFRLLDGFRKSRSRSQQVFEEENHNLYLDPVREVDMWTNTAISLVSPLGNEDRSTDPAALIWISALAILSRALDQIKEFTEVDGKTRKDSLLGYTSAPEAFSALFAIICLLKLCSQCITNVSSSQKLCGWFERTSLRLLLRYFGRDAYDDGPWLQNRSLRAWIARLDELLVSKLDDLYQDLDSHVIEEAGRVMVSHLPASRPVDAWSRYG